MKQIERGMLLLCSDLGDADTRPLSLGQFRALQRAVNHIGIGSGDPMRDLQVSDLTRLGYSAEESVHLVQLLSRETLLDTYLAHGARRGIFPVTRLSDAYPSRLIQVLGDRCPPVLFCAGDPALFHSECVALVGSRKLCATGERFASSVGRLAAEEALTLVSGGAPGADTAAQDACLSAGGSVISFLAGSLYRSTAQPLPKHLLLCSERGYTLEFSILRASSRNRLIHTMGQKALVAQSDDGRGGTYTGTMENLTHNWSPVFVHDDKSAGAEALCARGATPVSLQSLYSLRALQPAQTTLF